MNKTLIFALVHFIALSALADVEINETTFPNENFRNWVLNQDYGKDGVLTEEEIAGVTEINVMSKDFQSLKGIEYFAELTNLDCSWNQLPSLDVSKNTALKELNCQGNQLKELNLLNNIALENLACNYNQLTSLDVSKNSALTILACIENQLTELNLSGNNMLKRLVCPYNQLTSINVSGCTALESFRCAGNKLAELDVSGCPVLNDLICMSNQIKGEAMDALVESLPTVNRGHLGVINHINEQNVMTKSQVAVAKAKGWYVQYNNDSNQWKNYEGSDDFIEPVTFTAGQIATIILPTNPDASKGKYYRLDRYEDGQIIFEQELQPQAHIPYIIVPNKDFSIDLRTLDLTGLSRDTVSIAGISFIGSFTSEEFEYEEGAYIDIIDKTPDCRFDESCVIGALRAYLLVHWDDPYNQGGTRVPPLNKRGIVLRDYETGISMPSVSNKKNTLFDLQGRKLQGKPSRGIYIGNGQKILIK